MMFRYIVAKTKKVSIGPLEYCGHATLVKTTHQQLMSVYFIQFLVYMHATTQQPPLLIFSYSVLTQSLSLEMRLSKIIQDWVLPHQM